MLDFIVSNWFWLLFLAAMLFMHLGHGGHGGCGGHAHEGHQPHDATTTPSPVTPEARRATHR